MLITDLRILTLECTENSTLQKGIESGRIKIPKNHCLPNDENGTHMPFVFIGDEIFALSSQVMRPFPDRNQGLQQSIFNYHLCRARRMVEYAFGILTTKWKIFQRTMNVDIKTAITTIKVACTLHNFVRKRNGVNFKDTLYSCSIDNIPAVGVRSTDDSCTIRQYLTNLFISP